MTENARHETPDVAELRRLLAAYRAASGLAPIVDAWYEVARAAHAALPALLDADAERDRLARLLDEPRRSGCAVEIAGVRIAPCDERGQTADMRERDALLDRLAHMREARDAARAEVKRLRFCRRARWRWLAQRRILADQRAVMAGRMSRAQARRWERANP